MEQEYIALSRLSRCGIASRVDPRVYLSPGSHDS